MKPYLTVLMALVLLLTACGGGASDAQATAALETAIAALLQQSTAASTSAPVAESTAAPLATVADNQISIPNTAGCLPVNTERVVGTVVQIYNGDAAIVDINGEEHEVRYIGIDAPGPLEAGGQEALNANIALVAGKQVLLVMDKTDVDEYGRLPRYVIVDGIFVNLELVQQGVAFHSNEPPDESCKNTLNQGQ